MAGSAVWPLERGRNCRDAGLCVENISEFPLPAQSAPNTPHKQEGGSGARENPLPSTYLGGIKHGRVVSRVSRATLREVLDRTMKGSGPLYQDGKEEPHSTPSESNRHRLASASPFLGLCLWWTPLCLPELQHMSTGRCYLGEVQSLQELLWTSIFKREANIRWETQRQSPSRIRGRAGGGMVTGCLGLDTQITFSTSDFPSLVKWPVRVTKTVPQAPGKIQAHRQQLGLL